jgi:TonB-dependent starch-binding outer membrane protein SusC
MVFGLTNSFKYDQLDFSFNLRGAFGHSLINENRVFYEANVPTSSYNAIRTSLYDPTIKSAAYNSSHVEKADFVRLENLSVGYTFDFAKGSSFRNIRAYVSARNLMTFTSYTGVDPEVHYEDVGNSDNGTAASRAGNPDPLAPGIDRRSSYYPTKAITFGVSFGF